MGGRCLTFDHLRSTVMSSFDTVASVDQFFVKQRLKLMVNEYDVSTVGADEKSAGEPVCFVKQKRLKIREEINFFADEGQKEHVLQVKKRNVLELRGLADVKLPSGELIGSLRKVFGKSLLRSTWEILDPAGNTVATAHEKSMLMAILRRVWGVIPYVGDIPFFIPFHFDINIDGQKVGDYVRPFGLTDRYLLDLRGDSERRIDRRVAVAFTVALDALQDR
jgi:uncharacterized protein YxjI